jgi:RNA polymerase sigma-70 factor (ECF subfamily)
MAMLLVLETLAPTERAVFVLREVFDLEYDEIAKAVDKSVVAVRQIAHRAREHVAARRPRGIVSEATTHRVLEAFQRAIKTGEMQHLLDVLAPNVVLLTDGGGVVRAALAPITGAANVAPLLGRIDPTVSLELEHVNGYPALIARRGDEIDTVIAMRFDDDRITGLYAVRNPEKLSKLARETPLRR